MKSIKEFEAEIKEKHYSSEIESVIREYARNCIETDRVEEYNQLAEKLKKDALQKIEESENLFYESIRVRNEGNIDGILSIQLRKAMKVHQDCLAEPLEEVI